MPKIPISAINMSVIEVELGYLVAIVKLYFSTVKLIFVVFD